MGKKGDNSSGLYDAAAALEEIDFSGKLADNQREWAEKTSVDLVFMGPEKPLYSWFGHTAFLVTQPDGSRIMYDYGVFDSSKKGFWLDFCRGRMLYSVWRTGADWRLESEAESGRSVRIVHLSLTPAQRFFIIAFLQENSAEGNNKYLYHFYKDNCSTRLRDILDAASGGAFRAWAEAQEGGGTYRSWASRSLSHNILASFALNYLEGPEVDEPIGLWERMFLPEELEKAVLATDVFGAWEETYSEQDMEKIPYVTPARDREVILLPALAGLGLGLAVVLLRFREKAQRMVSMAILLFFTVFSLFPLYCMIFTDLDMAWYSSTPLFLNPLLLAAFFRYRRKEDEKAKTVLRFFAFVVLSLIILKGVFPSVFIQENVPAMLLVFPFYLTGFQGVCRRDSEIV